MFLKNNLNYWNTIMKNDCMKEITKLLMELKKQKKQKL